MAADSAIGKALDSIDLIRRRMFAATIVMWLLTFAALLRFVYIMRTTDNLKAVIAAAVVALAFAIFLATVSISFFITRMTKRLLRAIYTTAPSPSA